MNDRKRTYDDDTVDLDAEDAQPEDVDLEAAEASTAKKLKDLRDKLKACEKEKMAHLEALQRTKADYLNSKRRLEEERAKDTERVTVQHIEALLPLCDSFDAAMRDQAAWEKGDATWRKGIEGIHRELMNILERYDVESFGVPGDTFDPEIHEAVGEENTESSAPDVIHTVLQRGYRKGETVIRPARVIVGTE